MVSTQGQFRAELLKNKSKKNMLSSEVKSLKVNLEQVNDEFECIQVENTELQAQMKTKTQNLSNSESKVHQIVKEKEGSEIMIANLLSEVKHLKELMNESCKFCGNEFRNKIDLEEHVKKEHNICQGTQYEATSTTNHQEQNSEEFI